LALLAKFFKGSPGSSNSDRTVLAPKLETKAKRSYDAAVAMFNRFQDGSACSNSPASDNCIGAACVKNIKSVHCPAFIAAHTCALHHRQSASSNLLCSGDSQMELA
jgi:hypothetical protein